MADDSDMVLIMGLTGSGKSRFLNLLKPNAAEEGHGLRSCKGVRLPRYDEHVLTVVRDQ
jgi:ABC-type lipoprotein export system ATPase subunit